MNVLKTIKGDELNLRHYKGKSVVDYWFDMLEDDGTEVDLSVYSNIKLEVFAKRGGTLIDSFDNNSGLKITGNRINWNASKSRMDVFRSGLTYYHHMIGTLEGADAGQQDVLFYGNSEMI